MATTEPLADASTVEKSAKTLDEVKESVEESRSDEPEVQEKTNGEASSTENGDKIPKADEAVTKTEDVNKKEEAGTENVNNEVKPNIPNEELEKKIVRQIEYYFGNFNLPRDKYLKEQIEIGDSWVSFDVLLTFKRLAEITKDIATIRNALKNSSLIEVHEDGNKIRRSPNQPLPFVGDNLREETIKRTIYCKGLPKDGSVKLDTLLEFFKPYGPFENIHMRHFYDKPTKKHGFKGSILIVFPSVEKAQEFMDVDDIMFSCKPVLRKWHKNYLEEKEAEFEERKARKEARSKKLQEENATRKDEIEPLPKGTFLHMAGFSSNTTREDIKAVLNDTALEFAHIDFFKGNTEGFIRLSAPDSNKEAVELLQGKLKVNDDDITIRIVEGEEEETQLKKASEARAKSFSFANRGNKRRNRGRGGGGPMKRRKY